MQTVKNQKKLILAIVGALALVIGAYFGYQHFMYVSTDDAQVNAHLTMLSSRVNGTIQKVFAEENQRVKAGEVLAQIDTSDFSNAFQGAEAQVASLQARAAEAQLNLKRAIDLFHKQAISREKYDEAQANAKEFSAKLEAAKSQREQANLNVSYTKILAPADGVIARKSIEPGQFVLPGQPLFGFVASDERWIVANLKETELGHVKTGQKAYVEVDAVPGRTFEGQVESISPSTGAVFSLLPPDNSTGNFTKVVQRVPVRIRLDSLGPNDVALLQAGLSADVSIRVH